MLLLAFVTITGLPGLALGLDNGLTVPPMGWSSWYGFTQNIDEGMLREMGDGMISSGLHAAGLVNLSQPSRTQPPSHPATQPPTLC